MSELPNKTPREKEVCTDIEEEDGNMFLTGKNPFFDMVLTNSNIKPYYSMPVPAKIVSVLPSVIFPVVLRHGGKNWDVSYTGGIKKPTFRPGWKEFVDENHLKVGDACIFELIENTSAKVRFKVIILRNEELPPQLQVGLSNKPEIEKVIEID